MVLEALLVALPTIRPLKAASTSAGKNPVQVGRTIFTDPELAGAGHQVVINRRRLSFLVGARNFLAGVHILA